MSLKSEDIANVDEVDSDLPPESITVRRLNLVVLFYLKLPVVMQRSD